MSTRLVNIDGIERPLAYWLESTGIHRDTFYDRVRRGWDERKAILHPSQHRPPKLTPTEAVEHDTETDTLCESGEPDRRVIVYGMVCCGTTDEGIVEATGFDAAEVANFRADCPAWWAVDMRRHKEFDENKGVGR